MGSVKKFCGFKNMKYFETYIDINNFAAKRDCSRIYPSLPNATTDEIYRNGF